MYKEIAWKKRTKVIKEKIMTSLCLDNKFQSVAKYNIIFKYLFWSVAKFG
jgi:hypothetical protein